MRTSTQLWMRAPARTIYRLASQVECWPEFLPHYRWVKVLERRGNARLVEMAASRDGIPVWWQAIQWLDPDVPRIRFRHVRGITKGMDVEWSFTDEGGGTLVRITHALDLRWPIIGAWIARRIIGPLFIENIAGKTLRHIRRLAEEAP
jgi:ribosome-associated toxin RatA of RatAB toxin-antitoxin module